MNGKNKYSGKNFRTTHPRFKEEEKCSISFLSKFNIKRLKIKLVK